MAADEGAVTGAMMHQDRLSRVFITPNAFVGCSPNRLVERVPFEMGTDDRYAFDPGINAVPMSSSLE